jgi:hypothetical protein
VKQKKREILKCVVAARRNRDLELQPRHLVTMDRWNGQQRAVAIKNGLLFRLLQFLLGFFKSSRFFGVTLYIYTTLVG